MPKSFREHLKSSPSLEEMAKRTLSREQTKSFADLLIQTLKEADAQFSPAEFLGLPQPVQDALRSRSDPRVDFDTLQAPKDDGPSKAMRLFEKLQSRLRKAPPNHSEKQEPTVPRRRLSSRVRPEPGQRRQGLKIDTGVSSKQPSVRRSSVQASPRTIMFRSGDLYLTATEVFTPESAEGEATGASYTIRAYTNPPTVTDEPFRTLDATIKGDDDICVWPAATDFSSDEEDSEPTPTAPTAVADDYSEHLTPLERLTAFLQKAKDSKGDRVDVEALDALRHTYEKRCGGEDPDCPHIRTGMHPNVHRLLCGPKRPASNINQLNEANDVAPKDTVSSLVPDSQSRIHPPDALDEMFQSLQMSGQGPSFKERMADKDAPKPETSRGRGRRRRRRSIEERERPTIPVRASSRTRTGVSDPENGPRFGKRSRPPLSRSAWAHDKPRGC